LHEINLQESQNFSCCHCVRTICIAISILDTVRELRRVNCFAKCRLESILTDGMYARWCTAWALGRPQGYFKRLPKYRYTGQREVGPKLARCVESDQSNIASTATSVSRSSSGCHPKALILASSSSIMSELYISV
jgi:hypothetical protein